MLCVGSVQEKSFFSLPYSTGTCVDMTKGHKEVSEGGMPRMEQRVSAGL